MSSKKKLRFSLIMLLISVLTVACASAQPAQNNGETPNTAAGAKFRVGAVVGNLSNPAVAGMVNTMKAQAAKYPNIELVIQDSRGVEEQVAKAETMLAQGIKVLAIHPWEGNAVKPLLKKAKGQKIAVAILIDDVPGAVDEGLANTFISGDELEGGKKLGSWLSTTFKNGGKAAVVTGTPGNLSADYRTKGFKDALAGSNWSVVTEQTANWQRDQGLRVFSDILTAHPDIKAVFANNDEMAFGALQAIKASGKKPYNQVTGQGDIVVMGYNGTCIGLEATFKGDFAAEGVLPFEQIGSLFLEAAEQFRKGEKVDPRIKPDIPALDTQGLKGIMAGTTQSTPEMKAKVEQAASGKCS